MHKVCMLGRGVDGPAKSVLDPMGGGSTVSVRASYFFAGSLQNRIKESELFRQSKLFLSMSLV